MKRQITCIVCPKGCKMVVSNINRELIVLVLTISTPVFNTFFTIISPTFTGAVIFILDNIFITSNTKSFGTGEDVFTGSMFK